ncbi:DegT/DnrJ/EryC1/StrS family aminotransferase [Nonomuraea sp. H19]|uniref:DegT/DnrJ/EryC1/StrS family aminotransferase n=1 Tax=Nonomuraea sp. H19 TaxID=3452206 RepID=UPI003F8A05F4
MRSKDREPGGQRERREVRPEPAHTGRIHLSAPRIGDLEEKYVLEAMRSGWVAPAGPDVEAFEQEVATWVGVRHGIALNSGTAALHLALVSWGIGPGDVVVTSTMTFAATANAIVYTGAEPYFVDCEAESGNIAPDLLETALRSLRSAGERVVAIVPVDLFGRCADYGAVEALAAEYEMPVLADATEALGSSYRGRQAGSFGHAAALSFNGNKIMTTSAGGMLLTDDREMAERVHYLASQARQPVLHYEHTDVGYNYRLSNLLAALGRAQLLRLDEMLAWRRQWRELYRELFADLDGVSILGGADDRADNCWLTAVVVDPDRAGWAVADLLGRLKADDIEARPMWKPMHLQPVFAGRRAQTDGTAQRLFETGLVLPSGSGALAGERARVATCIRRLLAERKQ